MTAEVERLLHAIRTEATERLTQLHFPTVREEDWRYTDLTPIKEIPWQQLETAEVVEALPLPEADYQLVLQNGVWQRERSVICQDGLCVLGSVAGVIPQCSSVLFAHLGQYTDDRDYLTQLNSQACHDLALIYTSSKWEEHKTIGLHYLHTGHHCVSHPRCLIVLSPHTKLTVVEIYTGSAVEYWANPVTEIYVGEQAQLQHIVWQQQGRSAFHTKTTRVRQAKHSFYQIQTIDLGARLSRHNLHIQPQGEATTTIVQGLVSIAGEQLADTHSTILHSHPQGRSNQLHKCILRERSHGVFNGRICVTKAGQLTDASQLSRNLLLSPHARIDTKPQLEIVADNVKCSHGATVSQLDREELFYLQSRGIDQTTATTILTAAFAAEIINSIPLASLRELLRHV
ncbi:MAG: Fe-S cluster assembly protein SufD [Pseudanabaenaceae cyanobacterium]